MFFPRLQTTLSIGLSSPTRLLRKRFWTCLWAYVVLAIGSPAQSQWVGQLNTGLAWDRPIASETKGPKPILAARAQWASTWMLVVGSLEWQPASQAMNVLLASGPTVSIGRNWQFAPTLEAGSSLPTGESPMVLMGLNMQIARLWADRWRITLAMGSRHTPASHSVFRPMQWQVQLGLGYQVSRPPCDCGDALAPDDF